MPSRPAIFRRLVKRLSGTAPEAAEKVLAAEKALVKEVAEGGSSSLAGTVGEGALGMISPRAAKAVERSRGKIYEKARSADVSVADRLADVPFLGAAFRTKERVPIRTIGEAGGRKVKEVIEVPSASLLEPVEKAKAVTVPLLAFMGMESLGRAAAEGERQMEPKYSEMLKVAADTIRDRETVIEQQAQQIEQTKQAGLNLAGQVEALELEKEAGEFTLELLKREHITADEFTTKVAELVGMGREGIALEKRALEYVEKNASRMGTAEGWETEDHDSGDSLSTDPVTEYLMQYAYDTSPSGE